jgi:GR25 family glycosyltransferase involved in LPS biosynthesis
MIKTFIVYNELETDRKLLVADLKDRFLEHKIVKAIYPNQTHVPFLKSIQAISQKRTGIALNIAEIGCLLSHRYIWQQIIKENDNEQQGYLIVESDAVVNDIIQLNRQFEKMHQLYDLFFWGAFEGRVKLFRSSRKHIQTYEVNNSSYLYGSPFINSLYCTYGYSLNKKAAAYLLSVTNKFQYPVDFWKKNLAQSNLNVGAITPELISIHFGLLSNIQNTKVNGIKKWLLYFLVEFKNRIIVYFK